MSLNSGTPPGLDPATVETQAYDGDAAAYGIAHEGKAYGTEISRSLSDVSTAPTEVDAAAELPAKEAFEAVPPLAHAEGQAGESEQAKIGEETSGQPACKGVPATLASVLDYKVPRSSFTKYVLSSSGVI